MLTEQFWSRDIKNLWKSSYVIPTPNQSTEEQLNCISRLAICVFILLFVFKFKHSGLFLTISLLFIIIIYYIQNTRMSSSIQENYTGATYTKNQVDCFKPKLYKRQHHPVGELNIGCTEDFCDPRPDTLVFNQKHPFDVPTLNQKLVGKANPKTKINPIVVPPPADLQYWRTNNLVVQSGINEQLQQEDYLSGYVVDTCCDKLGCDNKSEIENYTYRNSPLQAYSGNKPIVMPVPVDTMPPFQVREGYVGQCQKQKTRQQKLKYHSGLINTTCSYDPYNPLEYGLASNDTSGTCQKNRAMKNYNNNLRTQILQPHVYTSSEINEPINSNIGISFTQQKPPLRKKVMDNGDIYYTEQDPLTAEPEIIEPYNEHPTESNTYDPRFYGYGTSYRTYVEPVTGQPRFMYDDINSIRMPNYVVRSKIDHIPEADKYGPLQSDNAYGNINTPNIRQAAQDSWLNNTNDFRNSMTQSLMRKRNNEIAQMRRMPHGTRMAGSN